MGGLERYYVHYNGGLPFRIDVNYETNIVSVGTLEYYNMDKDHEYGEFIYEHWRNFHNPLKIFYGDDNSEGKCETTNTLLLQMSETKYIFIGQKIFEFEFPEQILEYHSPTYVFDVPYPYAFTKSFVLFLFDGVDYLPIDEFKSLSPNEITNLYFSIKKGSKDSIKKVEDIQIMHDRI